MSRDYSKKKPARRKPSATPVTSNKNSRTSSGALIYLSIGLIVGLFIAFLVYLDNQPISKTKKLVHPANNKQAMQKSKLNMPTKKHSSSVKKTALNKSSKTKQADPIVPEYEFYTMLPDVEVEVNIAQTHTKTVSKTIAKTTAKTASTNFNKASKLNEQSKSSNSKFLYQLQVGAFSAKQKAESMKAQLAFMGVQSQVSSSWLNNGKKVYRVIIGPSSDEKKLKFIKTKLKKKNIPTFLKKL